MIDLIWILLFFFLMISTVRRDSENVLVDTVPYLGGAAAPNTEEGRTATLQITGEGKFVLEGKPVVPAQLRAAIRRLRSGREYERLVIAVDRRAVVEALLEAEDAGREAGLEVFVRRERARTSGREVDPGL
jgi:biopolymer transport protein ExbD